MACGRAGQSIPAARCGGGSELKIVKAGGSEAPVQQDAAAQQQADQIVANARTLAEQEGKKIVAQANRDAVASVEQAMDKLVADRTAQAYDAFLNSAEEGSGHAQQRS